jgi:hypothetical protein
MFGRNVPKPNPEIWLGATPVNIIGNPDWMMAMPFNPQLGSDQLNPRVASHHRRNADDKPENEL